MEYKTTYKFRIYPNKTQINKIDNILDLSYKLYNAMLEQRKIAYELNNDFHEDLKVNYNTQSTELSCLNPFPILLLFYSSEEIIICLIQSICNILQYL